jgi:hypothetical protein
LTSLTRTTKQNVDPAWIFELEDKKTKKDIKKLLIHETLKDFYSAAVVNINEKRSGEGVTKK